jgi:hypothetical protein
MADDLSKMSIT